MSELDLLDSELVGGAKEAIAQGNRDEDALTDLEFASRHPERLLLRDPKIQPGEKDLAKEWLRLRDEVVRPALAQVRPADRQAASPTANSSGTPTPLAGPVLTRNEMFAGVLGVFALVGVIGVALSR